MRQTASPQPKRLRPRGVVVRRNIFNAYSRARLRLMAQPRNIVISMEDPVFRAWMDRQLRPRATGT